MPISGDSDSKTQPRWTMLGKDELVDAYWSEVAPVLQAEGRDPETDRPSYEWLSSNGFRGLIYSLKEYHDTTFAAFWKHDLDTQTPGFDWKIGNESTINALERYLDEQEQRLSWSERTVQTHRYRLARYVRAYEGVNGTSDVLGPVARDSDIPAAQAVDACWDTFDALDRTVGRTTLRRIFKTTSNWYSTLVSRREAALNPTDGLDYGWSDSSTSNNTKKANPPLDVDHVRRLFQAASDTTERLLIVALCAWGLRSGEVAALHRQQLHLDDEQPHIAFQERKNGPGTVAVIYGDDVVRDRLSRLVDADTWNGYLFPSDRSSTGHRTRGTIRDRFHELADRADLPDEIAGRRPVPQMARRYWYDRYSDTVEQLVEYQISEIADEQGSASAGVVWQDYLSEERRRELRREFMREKLSAAFESVSD